MKGDVVRIMLATFTTQNILGSITVNAQVNF